MRDGVINILKPPGMTSNDVVYDVRRCCHIKRVGHTGTLDPGAGGVLPVCVGRATRLFDYLMDKDKEYIAEVTFGKSTDTLDAYGRVTAVSDTSVTYSMLENVIPEFLGKTEQTAPMYSAVSVGGVRLYKLARKGIEVERKKRSIVIKSIDIIGQDSDNCFTFRIICSKGTYVRTLCHDMAKAVGAESYVSFLMRTRSGRFHVNDAITIPELDDAVKSGREDEYIMPVCEALDFMPAVRLCDDEKVYKRLINGADISLCADSPVRVYVGERFLGIGECRDGRLRIKTLFYEV